MSMPLLCSQTSTNTSSAPAWAAGILAGVLVVALGTTVWPLAQSNVVSFAAVHPTPMATRVATTAPAFSRVARASAPAHGLQPSDAATVEQLSEESRLPQAAVAATTAPRPFQLPSWFYAALGLLSWVGAIVAYRKHQSQAVATGASVPPLAMLATAGQSEDDNAVRQPAPVSRRNLMGVVTAAAAGTAALSQPSPARAFGIGFPGYDLNVEARSRASKRNNNELEEARRRQIEARKKKLAEEAAVAGGQEELPLIRAVVGGRRRGMGGRVRGCGPLLTRCNSPQPCHRISALSSGDARDRHFTPHGVALCEWSWRLRLAPTVINGQPPSVWPEPTAVGEQLRTGALPGVLEADSAKDGSLQVHDQQMVFAGTGMWGEMGLSLPSLSYIFPGAKRSRRSAPGSTCSQSFALCAAAATCGALAPPQAAPAPSNLRLRRSAVRYGPVHSSSRHLLEGVVRFGANSTPLSWCA
eukprot:CAMPEP_0174308028 /NCGR_PEP_ID=MMETSP0810-20121108/1488_1 /TAXON_ID=73025 ORGANISM="Eutreptiella gymnastica-like, Strain CCMP1594" /NCGR_SAMPLE_ID=MMETSP0810 /ASSEMBLY_ACC=CAM_ASM_000659 /LENGTH=469 /DNA_ID=CAMNT_0015415227 /DNA_START=22 /DNA_END=1433 /DNA_ORIENTATION=+